MRSWPCPAGDQRDFEFARAFGLDIVAVQQPPAAWFEQHGIVPSLDTSTWPEAYVGEGTFVNSSNDTLSLDGDRSVAEAIAMTNDWLAEHGHGDGTINYRLRDWLFARQRYWGEPFPIVWDDQDLPERYPSRSCRSPCPRSTTSGRGSSTRTTRRRSPTCPSGGSRSGRTSSSTWATVRSTTGAT